MVTDVNRLQLSKAWSPMLVTIYVTPLSGFVTSDGILASVILLEAALTDTWVPPITVYSKLPIVKVVSAHACPASIKAKTHVIILFINVCFINY